jgi:hypothetical protein
VGPHRASFRYINHLLLNIENSESLNIPESKKQALENVCFPIDQIRTLEGRSVALCDQMADVLDFGHELLETVSRTKNWSPDPDGYFVGHHNV